MTAILTLLAAMLLAFAAIGEVRVVHHSRHAAPSPRCWQRRTDHHHGTSIGADSVFMTGH